MNLLAVKLVVVPNPFDAVNSAVRGELEYSRERSLHEYMGEVGRGWAASVNGQLYDPETWQDIFLEPDDIIVVSAVPYGGGGGKSILRFVAIAALTYVSGGIAGGAIGGLTGGAAVAAGAGVMIGGSLLINAILPPPTPDINDDRDISDSPTYGQDSARNTSESGIPIPLVYGGYRVGGNIISSYVENINDEQYLYVLYNAGEGEVEGFDDILVNDQPIANFSEVSYQTRNGTANQTAIGWFDSIRRQFNVNSTIRRSEWRTYTFRDLSDRASLEVTFPRGLYGINQKKGSKYSRSVTFQIQFRPYYPNQAPEENWQPLRWITSDGQETNANYTVTGKQSSALRRTIKTADLGENIALEVRIRRTSDNESDFIIDEATLATVTEISKEKVRYKHTALLGLRILMSEQLSSIPKVSYINKGLLVKVWDPKNGKFYRASSSNPAWISYDILTNKRYGAGIPPEMIMLDKFIEWGEWCDYQKLTFKGVLDTASNAFDILEPVMRLGHSKLFTVGTRVSVATEKTDYPVMMFSQANMIQDTFSIQWMPVSDRANEVEVTFYDEQSDFERRVIKVYDDLALHNGDPQRPSSFTLVGCTDEATAFYEGLLAINYNKYITQTYTFNASIDAIACTLGSVVYIQHDMPQWGYSGRVEGVNTKSRVNIDIDPSDMESTPDVIMIHHSALEQDGGRVSKQYDDIIEVDVNLPNDSAERVTIAGEDLQVLSVERHAKFARIRIPKTHTVYVGQVATVWETDVFEEREIADITNNEITVKKPFSAVPERHAQYLIGRNDTIKKKARILGIDYSDDHTRKITAIEYNPSVYDKNVPFQPSRIKSDLGVLKDTELANIDETLIQIGKAIRPRVTISYGNTSTQYQTTQVYISTNGDEYELIGTNRRRVSFESEDRAKLKIKLVAVDSSGIVKAIKSVPTIEYTVLGKTAPPADVTNFHITKEVGGIQLSWDANTELDIEGYEIRRGSSWDDGEIVTQALSSTILFFPVSFPGLYDFMIRAVDSSGNLSNEPSYAAIDLVRPDRVFNFNAVQHIDKIIMQWDRPLDRNITSFWIREGVSWDNSYIHGSVTGTSFEIPAVVGGTSRTFWIKAVDIIGIDSEQAVFATTAIASLPDRNMIYEQFHGRQRDGISYVANGYNLNTHGANPIQLNDKVSFGEYTAKISLPYHARARNSAALEVGVSVRNNETWASSDYTWDDAEANTGWAGVGDPEKIDFEQFISTKYKGTPDFYPGTKHLFTLNKTLKDEIGGNQPIKKTSIQYKQARYGFGAQIKPTTEIRWNVDPARDWTVGGWVRVPENLKSDIGGVALTFKIPNKSNLYLLFSHKSRQFILRQGGHPDLSVGGINATPGSIFYAAISQKGKLRTLRVRNLAESLTKKSELEIDTQNSPQSIALGFS